MGAVAPPPQWISHDDFLLKSAVEAGASLESLAKGAVNFSRRYTFQELQDRWCSLLYDPVVSVKASAHMLDFEYSSSTHQSRSNNMGAAREKTLKSRKRKAESVRKCYYAMCKRICHTPFAMMDGEIPSGPVSSNLGDRNRLLSADMMTDKPVLYNFGNQEGPSLHAGHGSYKKFTTHATECTGNGDYLRLESGQYIQDPVGGGNMASENFCHPCDSNVPLRVDKNVVIRTGQSKELPTQNLLEVDGLKNRGSACSEFGCAPFRSFGRSSSLPQMPNWDTDPGISAIGGLPQNTDPADADESPNYGLAISDLQHPISSDDMKILTPSMEEYFEELSNTLFEFSNDEELLLDKSYSNGFSSLLSESPCDIELPNVCLGESSVAARGNVVSNVKVFGPEYRDGVICCTLNSEDPEIPSNDDVFLPFRFPSPPKTLGDHWRSYDVPSSFYDFSSAQKGSGISRWPMTNQNNSNEQSRMIKPSNPPKKVLNEPTRDRRVKFELPSSNIQHVGLRSALNIGGPISIRSSNVNSNHTVSGVVKGGPCLDKHSRGPGILKSIEKNGSGCSKDLDSKVTRNTGSLNFVDSSVKKTVTKSIEKSQLSDQEEILNENGFDVPYFSDVEAMILDMDLSADECDLFTNTEVVRFQHEETKKTIIRLEQATRAYMQRAIAAQGAFAVLYDRRTKHFIKKTEVLLGRATDDVPVDIDLGREREGGKISRRQASIKMDSYGWFHLKNIGKCLIHVNGTEVRSGESKVLTSGCLIQVRGLAFMFETSETRIKQHVNSTLTGNFCSDRKLFIKS